MLKANVKTKDLQDEQAVPLIEGHPLFRANFLEESSFRLRMLLEMHEKKDYSKNISNFVDKILAFLLKVDKTVIT